MNRRRFVLTLAGVALTPLILHRLSADAVAHHGKVEPIHKTEDEWKRLLTPQQFHILREEGTEPAGSSPLNHEKSEGIYICAGCDLPLFKSAWKYDSGTGWPSFWTVMHEHIETKEDHYLIITRTEYHCARCGGHQGHVFEDGPRPTGERWCNNGAALKFRPV